MRLNPGQRAAVVGLWLVLFAAAATGAPATAPKTPPANTPSQPAARLGLRPDQAKPLPHMPEGSTPGVLGRMLAYGVVILALGGLGVVVVKRFLPRINPQSPSAARQKIHVAATTYLGPRKQLHILEVGEQRFLVASCRDSVSMIAELGRPFDRIYHEQIEPVPLETAET